MALYIVSQGPDVGRRPCWNEDRRKGGQIHQPPFHPHFLLLTLVPPTVWITLFNAHSQMQSHRSCSGTEASLEEMPTSPHVSTCLLSDCKRDFFFLSWLLMGASATKAFYLHHLSLKPHHPHAHSGMCLHSKIIIIDLD